MPSIFQPGTLNFEPINLDTNHESETQRLIDRYLGTVICKIFSLFYRFFPKETKPVSKKKILIILLSEMGALVLAYPMFQRLKKKFPGPRCM